jgi:AcrR family transcriptional regulator
MTLKIQPFGWSLYMIPTDSLEMQYNCLMAWDTQETRRRLQQAACEEFAAHGPDGTTMARIADLAGINKERLYNYFGDKRLLFETVLIEELEKLAVSLGANAPGLEDIGEYTGCIFDYHAGHPHLVRLLLWEGLADSPAVNEAARTAHYQRTVARFAEAQRNGILNDDLDPAKLVFLLIGLAAWWFAVPQLARMVTGSEGNGATERKRRRACVVSAAQNLASPRL